MLPVPLINDLCQFLQLLLSEALAGAGTEELGAAWRLQKVPWGGTRCRHPPTQTEKRRWTPEAWTLAGWAPSLSLGSWSGGPSHTW